MKTKSEALAEAFYGKAAVSLEETQSTGPRSKALDDVFQKFNPFHDERGRFSSGDSGGSNDGGTHRELDRMDAERNDDTHGVIDAMDEERNAEPRADAKKEAARFVRLADQIANDVSYDDSGRVGDFIRSQAERTDPKLTISERLHAVELKLVGVLRDRERGGDDQDEDETAWNHAQQLIVRARIEAQKQEAEARGAFRDLRRNTPEDVHRRIERMNDDRSRPEMERRALVQRHIAQGQEYRRRWGMDKAAAIDRVFTKYDPDQPRDDQGQWTETGAGGDSRSDGQRRADALVRAMNSGDRDATKQAEKDVADGMKEARAKESAEASAKRNKFFDNFESDNKWVAYGLDENSKESKLIDAKVDEYIRFKESEAKLKERVGQMEKDGKSEDEIRGVRKELIDAGDRKHQMLDEVDNALKEAGKAVEKKLLADFRKNREAMEKNPTKYEKKDKREFGEGYEFATALEGGSPSSIVREAFSRGLTGPSFEAFVAGALALGKDSVRTTGGGRHSPSDRIDRGAGFYDRKRKKKADAFEQVLMKYSDDQPRHPAGSADGGQWSGGSGGGGSNKKPSGRTAKPRTPGAPTLELAERSLALADRVEKQLSGEESETSRLSREKKERTDAIKEADEVRDEAELQHDRAAGLNKKGKRIAGGAELYVRATVAANNATSMLSEARHLLRLAGKHEDRLREARVAMKEAKEAAAAARRLNDKLEALVVGKNKEREERKRDRKDEFLRLHGVEPPKREPKPKKNHMARVLDIYGVGQPEKAAIDNGIRTAALDALSKTTS